jgi:hypothetical protein
MSEICVHLHCERHKERRYHHFVWFFHCQRYDASPLVVYFSTFELKPILLQLTAHVTRLLYITRALNLKINTHTLYVRYYRSQSRQSAKLFLHSSELGLPQPLACRRVCPPRTGGRDTLAGERGVGGSPNSDEGTYTAVLFILYVLCVPLVSLCSTCQREKV